MTLDIPPKLQAVINEHKGKYHRIAEALDVNVAHVHKYMTQGIEPKSAKLRKRMFLPGTQRKSRAGQTIPEHIRIWRHLSTAERNKAIKDALRSLGKL